MWHPWFGAPVFPTSAYLTAALPPSRCNTLRVREWADFVSRTARHTFAEAALPLLSLAGESLDEENVFPQIQHANMQLQKVLILYVSNPHGVHCLL